MCKRIINKSILLLSICLICIISISFVSATDTNNNTISYTDANDHVSAENTITTNSISEIETNKDITDNDNLCSNTTVSSSKKTKKRIKKNNNRLTSELDSTTYYINVTNFNTFFNENQILKLEYTNCNIVFNGNFNNQGVIKFYSDNLIVSSNNSIFYNTVFDLGANNIILANINMVLDKEFSENEYSAILAHGENITIYNCTIDYNTPQEVTAFGIYSAGHGENYHGLQIINNTINFYGHGIGDNDYNYAILLRDTHDSLVYGNTIYAELPLKFIYWLFQGSYGSVSTDTVATIAGDYCKNLTLSNNYIHSVVNHPGSSAPTLDTVVLYGCSYSLIEDNTIISDDFITQIGNANFLYALDLYRLNDVTIVGNNISVFTNGGISGTGTAYPIQLTGPIAHTKIAFNRLTTFNRGPNCGIYSNNNGGSTFIDIISNFINVTGDASKKGGANKDWCLVSGIEVQDNGDNILNNTIIVNNLGDYKSNNNVYGISYAQSISGKHTYNIQYNNITTNGNHGVKILGDIKDSTTYNSTISNNIINTRTTSKTIGASTNKQVDGPSGTIIKNNTNGNPKNKMSADYYPDWLKDYISRHSGKNVDPSSHGSGFTGHTGNGTSSWGNPGNANGLVNGNGTGRFSGNGTNNQGSNIFSNPSSNNQGMVRSNSSSSKVNPGVSDSLLGAVSAASPSDTGSSASKSKAYEVKEKAKNIINNDNYLPALIASAIIILLIFAGYKRKNRTEEE